MLVTQSCVLSCSVVSSSLRPHRDCSPLGSSVHGISQARKTGMHLHSLLQGIFPTQGLNQGLLHCRWMLYQLSYQGSPSAALGIYSLLEENSQCPFRTQGHNPKVKSSLGCTFSLSESLIYVKPSHM